MGIEKYLVPAGARTNICFDCKKACGGCSWSENFTPVPGWTARKVPYKSAGKDDFTYNVTDCPLCEREDGSAPVIGRTHMSVVQMTTSGKILKRFESARKAAAEIGVVDSTIRRACRLGLPLRGYVWKYECDVSSPEESASSARRAIIQMDESGNDLKRYGSIHEAAIAVGCFDQSICAALNGRSKTCKGYRWKYAVDRENKR